MAKYTVLDTFFVRTPCLPIQTFIDASKDDECLKRVVASDFFRIAIYLASDSLSRELDLFLHGECKKESQIRKSLYKYISRMSTRCTPFGLFANCAIGIIGEREELNFNNDNLIHARPDMMLSYLLYHAIQADISFLKKQTFKLNPTIYKVGKSVRYYASESENIARFHELKQVNNTPILSIIMSYTKTPKSFLDISTHLEMISGDSIGKDIIEKYIIQLIRNGFLISEIAPYCIGDEYFSHVVKLANKYESANNSDINEIARLFTFISEMKTFNGFRQCIKDIISKCRTLNRNILNNNIIQVDTFNSSTPCLSPVIKSQIMECVKFLYRFSPNVEHNNLLSFKQKFAERYEEQEVALLEVMDYDIGLGYPCHELDVSCPLIDGLSLKQSVRKSNVNDILGRIISEMNERQFTDSFEYDLSNMNDLYKNEDPVFTDLPPTMSVMFNMLAKDETTGEYLLGDFKVTGTSASNLIGRFSHCDKSVLKYLKTITDIEDDFYKDCIVAEICYLPYPHSGNVIFRAKTREYEIGCGTNSLEKGVHYIPVSDILVSLKNNQIVFKSKRLKKQIIPKLSCAHNYSSVKMPLYQFLCDCQEQHKKKLLSFSWGSMEYIITHFPRIKYKNIILSPERWNFSFEQQKPKEVEHRIHEIINFNKIPRFVEVTNGDNHIFLDLSVSENIQILISEAIRHKKLRLQEYLWHIGCNGFCREGKRVANECIVPLVAQL